MNPYTEPIRSYEEYLDDLAAEDFDKESLREVERREAAYVA